MFLKTFSIAIFPIFGSNCDPSLSNISLIACCLVKAFRYGLFDIIASKESAIAIILASIVISSPLTPSG